MVHTWLIHIFLLYLNLSTFHGSLNQKGSLLSAATSNNPPVISRPEKVKQVSPPPVRKEVPAKEPQPSTPTPSSDKVSPLPLSSSTTTAADKECILCEGEVDVVLRPCNHAVVCRECSKRAKKCPQCRVSQ